MHLADLLRLRTVPGAGLLLALTQRCPLSCAHCSTDSTLAGVQHSGAPLRRLVGSFTATDRPDVIFMSGGEPLLRPDLVADLATSARRAGSSSALLSGMFFARAATTPPAISRAIATLDHFSASIDVFHEREVPRENTFAALRTIADLVPSISLHLTSSDDTYLTTVLTEARKLFGASLPILVTRLQPNGRARSLTTAPTLPLTRDLPPSRDLTVGRGEGEGGEGGDPGPCEFANWPLVDYDGSVYACSRQSLVRLHRPVHLVLGHAARDSWPVLRQRTSQQPVLRSVRVLGAIETARRAGAQVCGGACQTCVALPAEASLPPGVEAVAQHLLARLRPRDLARRWGAGSYADLVETGWSPCAA